MRTGQVIGATDRLGHSACERVLSPENFVSTVYTKLGIGDRAEIEHFDGPHTINGQGTFDFLHKHLNWPKR